MSAKPRPVGRRAWQEGLPFIVGPLAAAAVLWKPKRKLAYASAALGLACAAFFRDPEVEVEAAPEDVLAPANGTVLWVDRVEEPWWIEGEADRVCIFLSITDIHVNRSPVEARLVDIRKVPGKFEPAMLKSENNCKDLLALEGPYGRVLVAQISGLIARRSVQWVEPGEFLAAGDRLGMIRFGSRTDVYLPAGAAEILVQAGDHVVAGRNRIARYIPY